VGRRAHEKGSLPGGRLPLAKMWRLCGLRLLCGFRLHLRDGIRWRLLGEPCFLFRGELLLHLKGNGIGNHLVRLEYLALALELQQRGHHPVLATVEMYREAVEAQGIEFRLFRSALIERPDSELMRKVLDLRHGAEFIICKLMMPALPTAYADIAEAIKDGWLVVSHPMTFAAQLAADKAGTATATDVYMQEIPASVQSTINSINRKLRGLNGSGRKKSASAGISRHSGRGRRKAAKRKLSPLTQNDTKSLTEGGRPLPVAV
jgi:hypothetical protein